VKEVGGNLDMSPEIHKEFWLRCMKKIVRGTDEI
jgi:hypothetical protein